MTGIDLTNAAESFGSVEISVRVWHPSEDPDNISRVLGLAPTLSYRAGDPRRTSTGKQLNSVHRETLWVHDLQIKSGLSLSDAILEMNELLVGHENHVAELKRRDARIEFFLGIFINGNQTQVLPSKVIQRCADLGVDVVLNIYPAS